TASASPQINSNFDNYKIPASGSPLLNKGTNTLAATTDIRALARPTNNTDIGCFESEVPGSGLKPLLKSEVGVVFDGGPSSYPVAGSGDSKPTILTAAIASASVGTSYYQLMQASGGDGLLNWSISSGSLPLGLTLSGGGIFSGTPTTAGTYTFTVRVTDSDAVGPDYAEKAYSLMVASSGGAKLTISSVKAYSTSSGSKTSYSYDGATNTRWSTTVTSKNPNTNGTNFGKDCAWIWWDLGENKNLTSLKLNWYNGSTRTYAYRIDSATNTNSWTTILPKTNSTTNGLTNGYQTVNIGNASGRYVRLVCWGNSTSNGYIHVTESEIYGSTTATQDPRRRQSIVFGALDPALETDPPVALSAYSLSESNASTDLPVGYDSSDPNVAVIDGSTVTITGSGSTWITASQSGDTNYQAATPVQQILTVTAVVPDITSATTVTAQRGLPFRYQITASREATSFGASGLPAGLTVNSVSGRISGTPTEAGSFAVNLSAQNAAGTGTAILNLNVVSPYVYETFESYTNGIAVPLVAPSSVTSGIKASGQVTNSAGNSIIGGVGGKVAWFNDTSTVTGGSGQLEFNAGASGQSYLAASFELYNNATPSAAAGSALSVAFAAWNGGNATAASSNIKKIANLEFNQAGSLTTPAWYVKRSGTNTGTVYTGSYAAGSKQTVHLFANDHDTNAINYVGPDGNVRALETNNFAVFLNGGFIGSYPFQANATGNDGTTVLTGNNNLGRFCFNTTSSDLGNWLIDNVVVSDMPTDVVIPAPSAPIITSPSTASGQAGYAFTYNTTTSELPDSYVCEGTLPTGLSFNPATGAISGTPNQSGVFLVTIYAGNSAGTGSLDVTITITPAPPNIFSGSDPSLNTAASWSLGAAPTASSSGGSYTDLVFSSSATNLTTSAGNINGKSWNVTNGLNYTLSSVRTNIGAETTYKIGNTGGTDTSPFTNTVTGATNELIYLANNSSLTLSPASPSNSIPAIAQLRNSGNMRIETGSTLHIPCNMSQSTAGTSLTKTGGGKLSLSGSNTYSGTTTINEGTLALGGSNASAVTIKSNSILETSLTGGSAPSALLSGTLTLEPGAKVRVVGTPAAGSTNTLVASAALSGTPVLLDTIAGFQLSNNATSLFLVPSAADTVKPVIFLDGTASVSVDWGSSYLDAGATATDDRDSVVTVTTSGSVDTSVLGNYLLTYRARDTAGNDANPVNRTVSVQMIDPASSGSDGVPQLLKYALGGTSAGSTVTLPIVSSATDFLILTATVRTNDPALAITGQAATDLSGSGNWTTSGVSVFPSLDQQAVPPGCQKRDFSVEKGAEQKKFLRLLIIR
ncbi:MAG: putative Ig domain-containing protein, partial [Chthoniobacterales bacterium]|nr:putative Ig domain-containing protein [Chthoniobacterales bacterium]